MSQLDQSAAVVVPHSLRWHGELAVAAAYVLYRSLSTTLRVHFEDTHGVMPELRKGPIIMAFWHNRLALSLPVYRHFFPRVQPHRRAVALVSASKDGALLAHLMDHHGVKAVRGSSSRRGSQAMRELVSLIRRGYDLGITVDGPRGPKYDAKEGIVLLAQLTGLPVVPMSGHIHSKKIFGSWDAFQLPLPFARCDFRVGQPVRLSRESGPEEREAARLLIQERLREITTD